MTEKLFRSGSRSLARVVVVFLLCAVAGAGSLACTPRPPDTATTASQPSRSSNCTTLSASDLEQLRQLQEKVPYPVLVPACLPAGYSIDVDTVGSFGNNQTKAYLPEDREYENLPGYRYTLSNGSKKIRFLANFVADVPVSTMTYKEVRGRQAPVYHEIDMRSGRPRPNDDIPFEESSYYVVLWHEDRDTVSSHETIGGYAVDAHEISWEELIGIIESMVPVSELVGDADVPDAPAGDVSESSDSYGGENCSIRGSDWATILGVKKGNDYIKNELYIDLDSDGDEEAIVHRQLEGSGSYFDVYVFTCVDGEPQVIKDFGTMRRGEVLLGDQPGTFIYKNGIFTGEDRNCCPSQTAIMTYAWSHELNEIVEIDGVMVDNHY